MNIDPIRLPDYRPGRRNLITTLDWGLGHASRSLALARHLERAGEKVIWAAAGNARKMLMRDTPRREVYALPPYRIRYYAPSFRLSIARQLPRIWAVSRREHRIVNRLVDRLAIDRIISDNRFGTWSAKVPSILLTHQLRPRFGVPLAGWFYRRWLRHFSEAWVPDHSGPERLSGRLSDPSGWKNVSYIGPLSRFYAEVRTPRSELIAPAYDTFALLSGPEPQRSRLEALLLQRLSGAPGRHLLVRGLPDRPETETWGNCEVRGFADVAEIAAYFRSAKKIICRSGYSTLMDLVALGCDEVVLVPTPGQTEQEYLAERAQRQGWAKAIKQDRLFC